MGSWSFERALRLLPWAFLVLVALGGIAPAEAGCSHYVESSLSRSGVNSRIDPKLFQAQSSGEAEPAPAAPRRDLPCSGPSCSRGTGLPRVPASFPSARSDQWCCATALPLVDRPGLADDVADPTPHRPRRSPFTIERPPRFRLRLS